MTPKEFFDKVVEMRRCQKEYFKNKRQMLKFMMAGENITYMNVINAIIIR